MGSRIYRGGWIIVVGMLLGVLATARATAQGKVAARPSLEKYANRYLLIYSLGNTSIEPGVDGSLNEISKDIVTLPSEFLEGLTPCLDVRVLAVGDSKQEVLAFQKAMAKKNIDTYIKKTGRFIERPSLEQTCAASRRKVLDCDSLGFVLKIEDGTYLCRSATSIRLTSYIASRVTGTGFQ